MERALQRAEQVGNVRAQALCHHGLGAVRFFTGEWAPAEVSLHRGIELASSVDSTFGVLLGEHRLAILETASGKFNDAAERLGAALHVALASGNPMVLEHSPTRLLTALAASRLAAGDLDGATEALERGFEAQAAVVAQGFGECVTCDVLLYPVAVAVRLARGELAEAEVACRRVEESTTWFHSRVWIATAHETRALLARAEGNIELAVDQFEQARAGFAALGQPFDEARCLANVEAVRFSNSTPTNRSSPSTRASRSGSMA
jgi:tetratricopeptide (TPR) repeat protein